MNNKSFLAASFALAMVASPVLAQETVKADFEEEVEYSSDKHAVQTNSFKYNWFVSGAVGGQIYFGDHDKQAKFGDRIAPSLDVAFGKWFIPGMGVRMMYSGLQAKGATKHPGDTEISAHGTGKPVDGGAAPHWLEKSKFNMMNLHVDAMFNLNNLIKGYDEKRVWSFIPYVGIGWAHVYDSPKDNSLSGNFGIMNSFRINSALDVNLDVRGTMLTDEFDGERGHRSGEGMLSVAVGVTYKFKPRGWDRSKTLVRYNNAQLNELMKQLEEAKMENERLRKALAEGSQGEVKTIVKKIAASTLITFPIGKSELTKQSRVNVGMLADVIKRTDPKAVYTVTGYADAGTGSKSLNERLSKERAEAVYNCLVKEFGVNPSQLKIDYKGGVDNIFYDNPKLSRAVISYTE